MKRVQSVRNNTANVLRSDFADFLLQQPLDRISTESPILRVGYPPRPVETFVGLHWPVEICGYSGQRFSQRESGGGATSGAQVLLVVRRLRLQNGDPSVTVSVIRSAFFPSHPTPSLPQLALEVLILGSVSSPHHSRIGRASCRAKTLALCVVKAQIHNAKADLTVVYKCGPDKFTLTHRTTFPVLFSESRILSTGNQ